MGTVAEYIEKHPEKTYYADYLATGFLRYKLKYNPNVKIEDIGRLNGPADLGSDIMIVGGARGVDIHGDVVMNIIPEWARDLYAHKRNGNLKCFMELDYPEFANLEYRKYKLRMYAAKPEAILKMSR